MINPLINKYKVKLNRNLHLKEILFGSANTLLLKVLGMVLALGVTLLISRKYGAEGIGLYNLSVRTIVFLALTSTLGINTAILRYAGDFSKKGNEQKLKLLIKYSIQIVLPVSILFGLLLFITSDLIANSLFHNIKYKILLRILSFILPFLALLNINVEYIRGLKLIKISEFFRSVSSPIINIILLTTIGLFVHTYLLPFYTVSMAIITTTIASVIFILKKIQNIPDHSHNAFTKNELLKTSLPMMVIALVIFLQMYIPLYFLEAYTSTDQVGIFFVSLRIAALISLVLIAVNTISAPKFSELYWSNQHHELQKVIFHSSKLMFIISLIIAVILVIFSHNILKVFGIDFIKGETTIFILIAGFVINSISGSVGILLNMTGHQKNFRNILLMILPINILLNIFFIPLYGINGAAIVMTVSISLANIIPVIYCIKKLNLVTFYLPYISKIIIESNSLKNN